MTEYETQVLEQLEQLNAGLSELSVWVLAGAFATSVLVGLIIFGFVVKGKDSGKVW